MSEGLLQHHAGHRSGHTLKCGKARIAESTFEGLKTGQHAQTLWFCKPTKALCRCNNSPARSRLTIAGEVSRF
jgi:hypothetical protein